MQSKIVDVSGRPVSEVAAIGPVVEVVRSVNFKLNLGNYQSMDFFCSQKASCAAEDVNEVSANLYEWCYEQVMVSVSDIKEKQRRKEAARSAA